MRSVQTSLVTVLGSVFLPFLCGCTAGNYDVADCDPSTSNLATDVCAKLSDDPNDCMPYQCDRASNRCVKSMRDWDRDGYPDSRCGGTDCDDHDPRITGATAGECSCKIAGMTCSAGEGACKRFSKYTCQNNIATCPALATQPNDWNPTPYSDAPNSYSTEDWNCDGAVERACCYVNSNGTKICGQCSQDAALCGTDAASYCGTFCAKMNWDANACNAVAPKLFSCNTSQCGARVAVCYCNYVLFVGCRPQNPTEERMNCR